MICLSIVNGLARLLFLLLEAHNLDFIRRCHEDVGFEAVRLVFNIANLLEDILEMEGRVIVNLLVLKK
jgi:hypothetical protein